MRATYIDGQRVFADGECYFDRVDCPVVNRFAAQQVSVEAFHVPDRGGLVRVIEAHDGQLATREAHLRPRAENGNLVSDIEQDILKIAVVNRYAAAAPAVGFVRGFGLKRGALTASVAHDSHNLLAVSASDAALCAAVNAVVHDHGGLAVASDQSIESMPLEIAGLMSRDGDAVVHRYAKLSAAARELGSTLSAPFMTLSFMALLVIPALKLSDHGLFDSHRFEPTSLYV
jgi:adenine deaminase